MKEVFRYLCVFFVCFILVFGSNFHLATFLDDVAASSSYSPSSLLDNTTTPSSGLFDQLENANNFSPVRSAPATYSSTVNINDQKNSDKDLVDDFNDLNDELNATLHVKNGGVDQYGQTGASVTNTIEHAKKLPDNVTVGNTTVNIPGYLDGAAKQILNVKNNKTNNIINPVNRTQPSGSHKDTIKAGTISKAEYVGIITQINKYMNQGTTKGTAPATITFTQDSKSVNMGYENLVYLTSQILYSYSMTKKLPDYIVIYPWSTITPNSTVFIPMTGISTATDTITSYAQTQHKLPSTITVDNHKLNMAAMLRLEARALLNLQGNLYQSILLKGNYTVPKPNKSGKPYPEDDKIDGRMLEKTVKGNDYTDVLNHVNNYINRNDLKAPDYADSIRGKIGFYSLVYLFADILNSAVHTNQLPDSVPLVSWVKLSNTNTKFLSMDQINTAAETVTNTVETQHTLPSTVKISGKDITLHNFLYLLVKSIKNIQNGYYGSIISPNYGSAKVVDPKEKGKFPKRLRQDTYMDLMNRVLKFYNDNKHAPSTINTNPGEICWKNVIFMCSQILTHAHTNNNQLPYYVGVNQWGIVTKNNTIAFSPSQIANSAVTVKADIEKNHGLSDDYKINIDGHNVSIRLI